MTFKALMNLGNLGKSPYPSIDRYHTGSSGYHHSSHGSYKSKSGGSGAALSALTLLAFLFLINVMQQSLQDNNSTSISPTPVVLLRDGEVPVVLDARDVKADEKRDNTVRESSYGTPPKTKNYVRIGN